MSSTVLKAVGAAITILGIIFIVYVLYDGAANGTIGEAGKINTDAWLTLLGWFFILIGPALWFGETPVSIKKKLKR